MAISREQIKRQAQRKSEELRAKNYRLNPKAEEAAKQRAFEGSGGVRGVGGVIGARIRAESEMGRGIRPATRGQSKKRR